MENVLEVETPVGVYLVWSSGQMLHFQLKGSTEELIYWNQIPEEARDAVGKAAKSLRPPPMVPMSANGQSGYLKFELA